MQVQKLPISRRQADLVLQRVLIRPGELRRFRRARQPDAAQVPLYMREDVRPFGRFQDTGRMHAPLLRLPESLRRFQLAGHVRQLPQPCQQAAGRTFADGEPVAALQHENGALLDAADAGGITLSYEEKQAVEGKKRKQLVKVVKRYAFSEVKYTKEYLDFK